VAGEWRLSGECLNASFSQWRCCTISRRSPCTQTVALHVQQGDGIACSASEDQRADWRLRHSGRPLMVQHRFSLTSSAQIGSLVK
jgi:hypothetical protein